MAAFHFNVRAKIVSLLLAFAVVPMAIFLAVLFLERGSIEKLAESKVVAAAEAIGDVIDRNLFERYGDVQAFAVNSAVKQLGLTFDDSVQRPGIVAAMNDYMRLYGIYRAMLLVDAQGNVIAAANKAPNGDALPVQALYEQNYAQEEWFKQVAARRYLDGTNGLSGTSVVGPAFYPYVGALQGNDGYSIVFAAPVTNAEGKLVGYWANFADFGLVEQIAQAYYDKVLASAGLDQAQVSITAKDGTLLMGFDAKAHKTGHDAAQVLQENLLQAEHPLSMLAAESAAKIGALIYTDAKLGGMLGAYARTQGAYDYPGLGWNILVTAPEAQVMQAVNKIFLEFEIMGLVILLIALGAGLWVGALAARPLTRFADLAGKIQGGETKLDVPYQKGRDEVGVLARALEGLRVAVERAFNNVQMLEEVPSNIMVADPKNDFKIIYGNKQSVALLKQLEAHVPIRADQMIGTSIDVFYGTRVQEMRRILSDPANLPYHGQMQIGPHKVAIKVTAIKNKDGSYFAPMLIWTVVTEREKLIADFEQNVKGTAENLLMGLGAIEQAMHSLNGAAQDSKGRTITVAAAAEEASQNVATVASAAEELAASIREISQQVSNSSRTASDALEQARAASNKVESLTQASGRIGEVITVISDIAAQTNLLALNATIEAARAGEAGKGFAVVASEVKNLASQTDKATVEVSGEVEAIRSSVAEVVHAIGSIRNIIEQMSQMFSAVAAAVEEQQAATGEISRNVQQAAAGAQEVSTSIVNVRQSAEFTERSAQESLSSATDLGKASVKLREASDAFLQGLKTQLQ